MQQNIFDNDEFFNLYLKLRNNPIGHNELIEKPAILSLLPPLTNKTILDFGCGYGDFCRYAVNNGAKKIIGVDISENMINLAKSYPNTNLIEYIRSDIMDVPINENSFDLVFSSLAIHYVEDLDNLIKKIKFSLKTKGMFVFSVEHPIKTSSVNGWVESEKGIKNFWKIEDYATEGKRVIDWLIPGVEKYHRKLETYFNTLLFYNFKINSILEPQPTPEILKQNPELYYEVKRPPFLMISVSH